MTPISPSPENGSRSPQKIPDYQDTYEVRAGDQRAGRVCTAPLEQEVLRELLTGAAQLAQHSAKAYSIYMELPDEITIDP